MGSRGITMRQSDCGLDLLGIIVAEQLRKVDFATFNVRDALEVLRQSIQNEIDQYSQQQRPPELKKSYMETLSHDFTHAALLVAECLADYYQTGKLIIFDYVGENYDPVKYHIKALSSQKPTYSPYWRSWKASRTRSIGSIRDGPAKKSSNSG